MAFLERFKERTSFLNKDGVTGLIAQSAHPIDKTPKNSQMNLSRNTQFKDPWQQDFSKGNGMSVQQTEPNLRMGMKNGTFDAVMTPKVSSKAKIFQENGNLTLRTNISNPMPNSDTSRSALIPGNKLKNPEIATTSQRLYDQGKNSEELVILTNIQTPHQRQKQNTIPNFQRSQTLTTPMRNTVAQVGVQEVQSTVTAKPALVKPIAHAYGKHFQNHATTNFENPYVNKYREYEYNTIQNQGNKVLTQPIQYNPQPITTTSKTQHLVNNSNMVMAFTPSNNGSLGDLSPWTPGKKGTIASQRGYHSEDPSPIVSHNKLDHPLRFSHYQEANGIFGKPTSIRSLGDIDPFEPHALRGGSKPSTRQNGNIKPLRLEPGSDPETEKWKAKADQMEKRLFYSQMTPQSNNGRMKTEILVDKGISHLGSSSTMRHHAHNSIDFEAGGVMSQRKRLSYYDDWNREGQKGVSGEVFVVEPKAQKESQVHKSAKHQVRVK